MGSWELKLRQSIQNSALKRLKTLRSRLPSVWPSSACGGCIHVSTNVEPGAGTTCFSPKSGTRTASPKNVTPPPPGSGTHFLAMLPGPHHLCPGHFLAWLNFIQQFFRRGSDAKLVKSPLQTGMQRPDFFWFLDGSQGVPDETTPGPKQLQGRARNNTEARPNPIENRCRKGNRNRAEPNSGPGQEHDRNRAKNNSGPETGAND